MATLSLHNLPRFEPGKQALNAKKNLNIVNGVYDWTRANPFVFPVSKIQHSL